MSFIQYYLLTVPEYDYSFKTFATREVEHSAYVLRHKPSDDSGPNAPIRLSVLEGEPTSLPCPIDTATREPITAVWYHVATHAYQEYGGSAYHTNGHLQAKRVYAIEAPDWSTPTVAAGRSASLVDGTHWKQPSWSGRAFFSLLSDPPALRLNRLERSDSGSYVCNVTYRDNVTSAAIVLTESRVDLFVAVAPTDVTIWSWPAQHTDAPSGSTESSSAATQHAPPPNFATMATTFGTGVALSDREATGREATATIRFGSPSGFSKPRSFECEATGSRPPANVTWFLDGTAVDPAFSHSVSASNVTTSMLLLPASAQSGRLLECRAINGNLPESRGGAESLPPSGHIT
ncbi:hypothetical protein MTO96_022462 [Rhipicephalus appendiculatus]